MPRKPALPIFLLCLAGYLSGAETTDPETAGISDAEIQIRKILNLPVPESAPKEESEKTDAKPGEEGETSGLEEIALEWEKTLAGPYWFLNHAFEAGVGFQRNVLKDTEGSLDAYFTVAAVETSGSLIQERIPVFNYYLLGERREYSGGEGIPEEDFVLLFSNLSLGKAPDNRLDLEATLFYMRQVMEDPLQQGGPSLLSLWSNRVRLGARVSRDNSEWFAGMLYLRESFDEASLDNDGAGVFARWKWRFGPSMMLQAEATYEARSYEKRLPREANGLPVTGHELTLDRFQVDLKWQWKAEKGLLEKVKAGLKLRKDSSPESPYDRYHYAQLSGEADLSLGRFYLRPKIDGNCRNYEERQLGFLDEEKQWKWGWGARVSTGVKLTEQTRAEAIYDYNKVDSNLNRLVFDEDSVQLRFLCEF